MLSRIFFAGVLLSGCGTPAATKEPSTIPPDRPVDIATGGGPVGCWGFRGLGDRLRDTWAPPLEVQW